MMYNNTVDPIGVSVCEVFVLMAFIVARKGRSAAMMPILAIAHVGSTQTVPFWFLYEK